MKPVSICFIRNLMDTVIHNLTCYLTVKVLGLWPHARWIRSEFSTVACSSLFLLVFFFHWTHAPLKHPAFSITPCTYCSCLTDICSNLHLAHHVHICFPAAYFFWPPNTDVCFLFELFMLTCHSLPHFVLLLAS